MPWTAELKLAELLAARLCHDLASPLAAIDNGIELLNEPGFPESPQALDLISSSAAQAVASLRFFRSALGGLGEINGQPRQVQDLAADWLRLRRVELSWHLEAEQLAPEVGRLLLNLLAVAGDALPRGGVVSLTETRTPAVQCFTAAAAGPDAQLGPEMRRSFEAGSAEGLDPREVQAYFLRLLAQRLGGAIDLETETGLVTFELVLRA